LTVTVLGYLHVPPLAGVSIEVSTVQSAAPPSVLNTGQCVAQGEFDRAAFYVWVIGPLEADKPGAFSANGEGHKAQGQPFGEHAAICHVPNGGEPA